MQNKAPSHNQKSCLSMSTPIEIREISYAAAVAEATAQEMERDDRVFVMGLDVDDHKSIQGSTVGLLEQFGPDRVFALVGEDRHILVTGGADAGIGLFKTELAVRTAGTADYRIHTLSLGPNEDFVVVGGHGKEDRQHRPGPHPDHRRHFMDIFTKKEVQVSRLQIDLDPLDALLPGVGVEILVGDLL